MLAKHETRTGVSSEIKVIPTWAWLLAGVGFVGAQVGFDLFIGGEPGAPPPWARPLLGLLVGLVLGCYLLLIGYINRDAKRRGMSPVLWTIVAIIIPNALGMILYFILRQSLQTACPRCGHVMHPGFAFCPQCSYKVTPVCPQCQRSVEVSDVYCPYCGNSLRGQSIPVSGPPTRAASEEAHE
jgi:RNA polymerase subunit RPABC4/transcription elongation factor Spt4